jgi:hypothetical protein
MRRIKESTEKEIKLDCGFMKESDTDGFALQRYVASESTKFGSMELKKGQEVWLGSMHMQLEIEPGENGVIKVKGKQRQV